MEGKDPKVSELPMISMSFGLRKRRVVMEGKEDVKHDFYLSGLRHWMNV